MTDDDTQSPFAEWYNPGSPIPVAHPIPWVYAEIRFQTHDEIEWAVYDYSTDQMTVETFSLIETEDGSIPADSQPV